MGKALGIELCHRFGWKRNWPGLDYVRLHRAVEGSEEPIKGWAGNDHNLKMRN